MKSRQRVPVEIHGYCPDAFAPVRDAFARHFTAKDELGASFALMKDGELVVDIWGGYIDEERSQPWQKETITNFYSTTKTISFLCMLLLADRNDLDFTAPVAHYWPEFAQNGKRDITVAHVMSHSAGLSGMDTPVEGDALYDWDWMVRELAAQTPWWEPGTNIGYHAITQGFLLGEVLRRITGQSIGAFLQQELAGPLQADCYIGTPASCDARVAPLFPPPPVAMELEPTSIAARSLGNPQLNPLASRTEAWRRAELPALNGHGNARSVATLLAILANGGTLQGKRFMSEAGARRALERQIAGVDLVLGVPIEYGMGFGLRLENRTVGPNPNTCFWGGWGGSRAIVDFDERMSFAYVMNQMGPGLIGDERGTQLGAAVYAALAAQRREQS